MKKLIVAASALLCLASCTTERHFSKGQIVEVTSLFKTRQFEIVDTAGLGFYKAWDLTTGTFVEKLSARGPKLVKSNISQQ